MFNILWLKFLADGAVSKEFRVVRDNRVNSNANVEMKISSLQHPSSSSDQIEPITSEQVYAHSHHTFSELASS